MGRPRKAWNHHPAYGMFLLMAKDAPRTGITAQQARGLLAQWAPSLEGELDHILNTLGDPTFLTPEVEEATADAIDAEEAAFIKAGGYTSNPAERPPVAPQERSASMSFSDQIRAELTAKRSKVAQTVEAP